MLTAGGLMPLATDPVGQEMTEVAHANVVESHILEVDPSVTGIVGWRVLDSKVLRRSDIDLPKCRANLISETDHFPSGLKLQALRALGNHG
jgi:hypothetical protein